MVEEVCVEVWSQRSLWSRRGQKNVQDVDMGLCIGGTRSKKDPVPIGLRAEANARRGSNACAYRAYP